MRRWSGFLLGLLLLMLPFVTQAQESFALGDIVQGEITADAVEVSYTFSADESAVIVVEMRRAEDSQLYSTALRVTDPSGETVADSTGEVSSDVTAVAFVAPAAGDYTVTATRSEFSDSTGTFLLRALDVTRLEAGMQVEDNISKDSYDRYFALPAGASVAVSYRPLDDSYVPTFRVLAADDDGILKTIALAAAIEDITTTTRLETDSDLLYIIAVTATPSDYQYSDVDTDFELSLEAAE